MSQLQTASEIALPTFSMILETENLENASLDGIFQSLASLEKQDLSPKQANEVWLIDSGDLSPQLLQKLIDEFPWIKVYRSHDKLTYYQAKMLGAQLATGEIVIYFDSDCIYEANWLRYILTPFAQNRAIDLVAGETTTRGNGPYGTAMLLTYIFPPYSGQTTLSKNCQYFLNNVAFRKDFLISQPIPTEIALYRGNCVIHAHHLCDKGYSIWKQPQAKATHAPPEGLSHFFWRFLLIGYDYYWQEKLLDRVSDKLTEESKKESVFGFQGKLGAFRERLTALISNPRHLINLPLAIPIVLSALILIGIGYVITVINPKYLLAFYESR